MNISRKVTLPVWVCVLPALAGCLEKPVTPEQIIATAKQKVHPALVYVKPIQETFRGGERRRAEVEGSGVIIDAEGYVVTNAHVAEKAIEVNCVLGDKEQVPATVVGLDPETDLALLKLKLPADHRALAVGEFGDSDSVEAGQTVLALGSPYGFERSVTQGIISNTRRYIGFKTRYRYNLWIQTDAAINPGNSGGPLVDAEGKIIGINTLGTWAEGIGFAIPSNIVRDVISRLRAEARRTDEEEWPVKVQRAYLGLQLQAINDFQSNAFTDTKRGVLIQSVDAGSPADRAGIRGGDILLAVDNRTIDGLYVENLPQIRRFLADLPKEQSATLWVARRDIPAGGEGPTSTPAWSAPRAKEPETEQPAPKFDSADIGGRNVLPITITPVTRGKFEGEDFDCKRWNMTVKEITKFTNPRLHFLQPSGGVFIQGVRGEGNASDANLRVNDILLKIGKHEISTLDNVKKAYESLVEDKTLTEKRVLIKIKRDGFPYWKVLDWSKDYLKED